MKKFGNQNWEEPPNPPSQPDQGDHSPEKEWQKERALYLVFYQSEI
jgi:hypothetical protein